MSTINRTRGDDYDIVATIKVDGVAIDLADSELKFSYKNADETGKTILGAIGGAIGEVTFSPQTGVDFMVEGVFSFDVQRIAGGKTYTHLQGTLLLNGDITV